MLTPHWIDLIRNSDFLDTLYSDVPPLESVRLRSFHLDWQGSAPTLRIDLPTYPGRDRVPPEWSTLGHDTLQLHVHFTAVEDLIVHGWIPTAPVDVSSSDWAGLLDDPQSIQGLYDEEPDLNQCDLFHVLADERGDSITL
ncbi:Imm50 family immunity protein [Streptomyces parvus]|uniref:Imm50 family immunity protein n=1 Tax=Streptomyces parvus TaxID=66428 RepID=UPI0033D619E4